MVRSIAVLASAAVLLPLSAQAATRYHPQNPALIVATAVLPHVETQQPCKVYRTSTSNEMVNAWTTAVFLGAPTAARTSVDQWVAGAYLLGRR